MSDSIPSLQVNGAEASTSSSTSSSSQAIPAPGTTSLNPGKRAELRMNMLKKLRPYPLRHEWVFWHDRNNPNAVTEEDYAEQLKEIAQISTIQSFWQVINNTPFANLPLRDSLHLFKKNVKPIWEDPRNKNGGAWTFRVPKATSFEFWKEILMAAIGEELQDSVEKGDDICGVSISVRFNSHLIMIWNRNGENQKSIDQILETVMKGLPEEMKPVPSNYYYKKHSAHKSFKGQAANAASAGFALPTGNSIKSPEEATPPTPLA